MEKTIEIKQCDIDALDEACRQLLPGGEASILPPVADDEIERVYARGYESLKAGQVDTAMVDFAYLVMNRPWDQRFQMALGVTLQQEEEFESALKFFGYGLYLDACDPRPTYHIAECLIALDEREDAREALQTAIDQSAGDPCYQSVAIRARALLNQL